MLLLMIKIALMSITLLLLIVFILYSLSPLSMGADFFLYLSIGVHNIELTENGLDKYFIKM